MYISGCGSEKNCKLRPLMSCSQLLFIMKVAPRSVPARMCVMTVAIFCAPCIAYKCGILYPPYSMGPWISARDVVRMYPIAGKKLKRARDWIFVNCSKDRLHAGSPYDIVVIYVLLYAILAWTLLISAVEAR